MIVRAAGVRLKPDQHAMQIHNSPAPRDLTSHTGRCKLVLQARQGQDRHAISTGYNP
jgi:hypothetical protein